MGNSRSKEFHHEKLEEHSERYFAKVTARNKIKTRDMSIPAPSKSTKKLSSFRSKFRGSSNSKSKKSSKNSTLVDSPIGKNRDDNPNPLQSPEIMNVRSRTAMLERAELENTLNTTGSHHSILSQSTNAKLSPKRKKKSKTKRLPKPRGSNTKDDNNLMAKIMETSDIDFDNGVETLPFENKISKQSFPTKGPLNSQKQAFKIQKDNRAFEATLNNGMIWSEIPRESKITTVSFSPCDNILAVGCESGTISIIHIGKQEKVNIGNIPLEMLEQNRGGHSKYKVLMEIPREGKIRTLDWSPDGKYLAVGGNDCTAAIIHLESQRVVHEIEREDRVYAIRWNPDGNKLAIGGFDGMVAILNFEAGEDEHDTACEIITEIPRLGLILTISWNSSGEFLAIGGSDKRAAIVHVENWEVVGEVQRPGSVQCLEWNPDGNILAVGGHDGIVAVIDIESRSVVTELERHNIESACRVTDLTWSPDGAFLSIAATDHVCAIYETKTFIMVHEIRRNDHVTCVDWQSDSGKYLAVGGDDRSVAILMTGGMLSAADTDGASEVSSTVLTESHSDDWSASIENDSGDANQPLPNWIEMDQLNEDKMKPQSEKNLVIRAMSFSHGSKYVAIAASNQNVSIVETESWSIIHEFPMQYAVQSLSFSPSNEYLALGSESTSTCIFSIASFEIITTIPCISSIHCLQFSQNSSFLALGDADGMFTLVNTSDWSIFGEMDESESPVYAIDFSVDELYVALGRNNALCSVHTCESVFNNFWVPEIELIRNSAINTISFSKSSDILAIGGGDWTVGVYSANDNWALIHELKMDGWILCCSWSIDSKCLAIGGTDLSRGVEVFDSSSWNKVPISEKDSSSVEGGVGLGEEVHTISWSDDGKYLGVAGSGGISRFVDTKTWSVKESIQLQIPDLEIESNTYEDEKIIEQKALSPFETNSPVEESSAGEKITSSNESSNESSTEILLSNEQSDPDTSIPTNGRHSTIPRSRKIGYSSRSEPSKFLSICDIYLQEFGFHPPESVLTFFNSSIRNLQAHTLYIDGVAPSITETIAIQEKGEPFHSLCSILNHAIMIMEEILEDGDGVITWWKSREKYGIHKKEIAHFIKWNGWWKEVDATSPLVDIGLLTQVDVDDVSENQLYENSGGYPTFMEDGTGDAELWSFNDPYGRDSRISFENEFNSFTEASLST